MALPPALVDAPVLEGNQQKTVRQHVNELDKSTIFSIYPEPILDKDKITIQPNRFLIPAGTVENPGRLVIGGASYWVMQNPEQGLIEIPIPSIQLADSIVKDHISSRIGVAPGEFGPGLFYLPGNITVQELKTKYKHLIEEARIFQDAWFTQLVRLADALWATTNGNPMSIDKTMKIAATSLNEEREWLRMTQQVKMIACVACGNRRNPLYPICPHCKAIVDQDKAKAIGLTFAS